MLALAKRVAKAAEVVSRKEMRFMSHEKGKARALYRTGQANTGTDSVACEEHRKCQLLLRIACELNSA